jgi:O-antigen/teichoic acid export membrane protein
MSSPAIGKMSRIRVQLPPLVRDLGLTAATQFTTFAGGLLVISLFGRLLGPALLGEYLLVRRIVAWLKSGTEMGLGIALPRSVAHALNEVHGEREVYLAADIFCIGAMGLTVALALYAGRLYFARWLFGSADLAPLILPLSLFLLGLLLHSAVYGYYRGCLQMGRANALEFIDLVLIPVSSVVLLWHRNSVGQIVGSIGVATVLSAGCFAREIIAQHSTGILSRAPKRAAELLRYGVVRVPGEFGAGALLSLGPIIAAHFVPLAQVSSLLLGISLLMAVSLSVTPLGLILLSKVSMMLVQDRLVEIRAHLGYLLAAILELSVFVCLQIVVFADTLIRTWVGPWFTGPIGVIRILALAIPPFLFYVALRSVIDAASVKAYNARSVMVALGIFLILTIAATRMSPTRFLLETIAAALLCSFIVLAGLTARSVRQLYGLRMSWADSGLSIGLALLLGATSFAIHWAHGFRTNLLLVIVLESAMTILFFAAAKEFRSGWMLYAWRAIFQPTRETEAAELNA